jgi:hypothetical protein
MNKSQEEIRLWTEQLRHKTSAKRRIAAKRLRRIKTLESGPLPSFSAIPIVDFITQDIARNSVFISKVIYQLLVALGTGHSRPTDHEVFVALPNIIEVSSDS